MNTTNAKLVCFSSLKSQGGMICASCVHERLNEARGGGRKEGVGWGGGGGIERVH